MHIEYNTQPISFKRAVLNLERNGTVGELTDVIFEPDWIQV